MPEGYNMAMLLSLVVAVATAETDVLGGTLTGCILVILMWWNYGRHQQ